MENVAGRDYLKKPEWGIGERNAGNDGNAEKCFRGHLIENWQKIFVTLSRFSLLRGSSVWSWMNPLKKENLRRKSFSDNVEWSSKKLWKMISTDIKTDVKQEIKELVAVSFNFSQRYLHQTEIQYKAGYSKSKLFFI